MTESNQKLAGKMLQSCSKNKGRGAKDIFSKMVANHVKEQLASFTKDVANEFFGKK